MDIEPRLVASLSLGALLPAAVFVVLDARPVAAVTFVNVVLITGALALAMSEHEGHDDHDGHSDDPELDGV
jgi:VIT1/CCC1 family predicted Fe2+/Mn2+ transporter